MGKVTGTTSLDGATTATLTTSTFTLTTLPSTRQHTFWNNSHALYIIEIGILTTIPRFTFNLGASIVYGNNTPLTRRLPGSYYSANSNLRLPKQILRYAAEG